MKKNALPVLALLATLLGLSACNDLTTPESTLGSAATAVQKDSLRDLRDALSGNALATYGNTAGLVALENAMLGMEFKTDAKKHLGNTRRTYQNVTDVYSLDVLLRAKGTKEYSRFKTATIVCEWTRGEWRHSPSHGGPWGYDGWSDHYTPDSTRCQITELN